MVLWSTVDKILTQYYFFTLSQNWSQQIIMGWVTNTRHFSLCLPAQPFLLFAFFYTYRFPIILLAKKIFFYVYNGIWGKDQPLFSLSQTPSTQYGQWNSLASLMNCLSGINTKIWEISISAKKKINWTKKRSKDTENIN